MAAPAPKPLYRDPIMDGAADASIIYDRGAREWKMFYTNRRATLRLEDPKDVAWVHATPIGIARSDDGLHWRYQGTAEFPKECTGETLWAPETYYEAGTYHLWLTVVPGVFHRWGIPEATSRIVHLTSTDLQRWACADVLDLGSSRVIDASVVKIGSRYRLWFKDERAHSGIFVAESDAPSGWTRTGKSPVMPAAAEGPKVFRFKGKYWLIADAWKGLVVLSSYDATSWTQQPSRILERPGSEPTDRDKGQHPEVVVSGSGDQERAFIFYFVHQGNEPEAASDPYWKQRTLIQVAELELRDGGLIVDRNRRIEFTLQPPGE
ncbi:hypothetical protein HNQ60_001347 [Povalibacter uvarum]|uniref:Glycoside hydrolase family 43 n=1 Tax=Povalibacter uvarum TaxID=732238 RepID=A0A841HJB0_9GAMM|nr:family 43 glycosylhydrolase [Povalibacter uvarum]MBB6092469.1 hypothetical protein [Povalibacter uvarum]